MEGVGKMLGGGDGGSGVERRGVEGLRGLKGEFRCVLKVFRGVQRCFRGVQRCSGGVQRCSEVFRGVQRCSEVLGTKDRKQNNRRVQC